HYDESKLVVETYQARPATLKFAAPVVIQAPPESYLIVQVAQDIWTEDQLVITLKVVCKTADEDNTSNDDFRESESEFKQELIAMLDKTALKHAGHKLKNMAIHKKKKSKKNMACS
ncbi:hypothetical protein C0995_014970, partial [Termitomyces sp. Mi166